MKNKTLKEEEKINKIWNETTMILADEDYDLSSIEDLDVAIKIFIGRAIRYEQRLRENLIKKILDVCKENDWDIMVKDGEDGDITISLHDWIKQTTGDLE